MSDREYYQLMGSPTDALADARWAPYFGFDEPYPNQADAIDTAIETGRERGYFIFEGPCGTGKTMAALTAGAHLVRETDQYDTVVVITPVKQQLQQFVADLRTLNADLQSPLDSVALAGKRDLCPYEQVGAFPDDVGVHDRCEDLREATADLVDTGEGGAEYDPEAPATEAKLRLGHPEDRWWDHQTALDLVTEARVNADTYQSFSDAIELAGVEAPYPRAQPQAPDALTESTDPPLYCPFEADWYARDKGSPIDFTDGEHHVITSETFLPESTARGTCPHRAMGVLLQHAEVVIGNYNHLFDPDTRPLLEPILDESTFVIIDEAHRLESRVRDLRSETIGRQSLQQARGDCDRIVRAANQRGGGCERIKTTLAEFDVPFTAVERAITFYEDLIEWLTDRASRSLETKLETIRHQGADSYPEEDHEVPLRPPNDPQQDELSAWGDEHGYPAEFWEALPTIGAAVEAVLAQLEPDRRPVVGAVGYLLAQWRSRDQARYFRELKLEYSPKELTYDPDQPWERAYTPRFVLYNCLPTDAISTVLNELGGGMLMSATLEPLDVFRAVTGLDAVATGDDERPISERSYELRFPKENRASWLVDAMPFTARNRGAPRQSNTNDTRQRYAYILREIATCPGNVMLCLPNYREAEWAASRLEEAIEKPVLLDESSSAGATDELKRRFFAGDGKVLVTSTRGTLTEGVDYDEDKLHTCAVIGVPLVNTQSPRMQAVRTAYADRFGEEVAFEYAHTVPAVRRSRQAIGRVVRGPDERGVRILADNRYTTKARYNGVHEYLAPAEQEEFQRMTPMFLSDQFDQFW